MGHWKCAAGAGPKGRRSNRPQTSRRRGCSKRGAIGVAWAGSGRCAAADMICFHPFVCLPRRTVPAHARHGPPIRAVFHAVDLRAAALAAAVRGLGGLCAKRRQRQRHWCWRACRGLRRDAGRCSAVAHQRQHHVPSAREARANGHAVGRGGECGAVAAEDARPRAKDVGAPRRLVPVAHGPQSRGSQLMGYAGRHRRQRPLVPARRRRRRHGQRVASVLAPRLLRVVPPWRLGCV